jgi:membrane associated rhomboid family serine protease
MFDSIIKDIRYQFDSGNMVTRLVIINTGVFILTALLNAFFPEFYSANLLPYLALPGDFQLLLVRPWTLLSHMFMHSGLWHLIWNMLTFYWFGAIAGDLLGDRRILPVFLLGGLTGAIVYLVSSYFLSLQGGYALGSSAAVLAVVFTAVATAPEYRINLLFFGEVRIKFIGLIILFLDIIGTQSTYNSGGHLAHLGGALFGFLFVYLLRRGTDLSRIPNPLSVFSGNKKRPRKRSLKVAYKSNKVKDGSGNGASGRNPISTRVDEILDKIKQNGYDSLTEEEKDILYQASKQ